MLSYDGNPDVLFFSHEPAWPFIKNSNQVHVHFLPHFLLITVELVSLLNWIRSHQLFLNKLFIIIKSPCNHLEKSFINLMSQQFD